MTDRIIKAMELHLRGTYEAISDGHACLSYADQLAALAELEDDTIPRMTETPRQVTQDIAERIVDALLTADRPSGLVTGDRLAIKRSAGDKEQDLGGRVRGAAIATVLRVLEGEK